MRPSKNYFGRSHSFNSQLILLLIKGVCWAYKLLIINVYDIVYIFLYVSKVSVLAYFLPNINQTYYSKSIIRSAVFLSHTAYFINSVMADAVFPKTICSINFKAICSKDD